MTFKFSKSQIALAALATLSMATPAMAGDDSGHKESHRTAAGKYVAGDFHNHTTCSDGSISMQKLVRKATGTAASGEPDGWGLDWFVQAGHGGNGSRNCTLTEDATLDTPVYPFTGQGPNTTWQNTTPAIAPKGLASGTAPNSNMWRWQSIQEFQYPLMEYLNAYKNKPLFIGTESVVAGHEHASMSVITGQIPLSLDRTPLQVAPVIAANTSRYTALGNANALAQWEYCFDRGDTDTSRGNATVGTSFITGGNNWNCAVTGSDYSNTANYQFDTTAQKLIPTGGAGTGTRGHLKTLEALKWMSLNHSHASYYVPAHLERAGPFNVDGNNGYNVEHLRSFNNAAPTVAFGFESQPGHGASSNRGEYQVNRNNFGPAVGQVDSVGGTTYGGTGVYAAQVGGVWDALLGEGRNWWFFASSDWHNRGRFGPDDRRSTQDFQPGEYQRNFTLVRNGDEKIRPKNIVDGLRSGNNFAASGQLIDRLAFVACASYPEREHRGSESGEGREHHSNAAVEALALAAAQAGTSPSRKGCATMGEKLVVRPGAEIVVAVAVRDPSGPNNSPYTFGNPSLAQVMANPPALNEPVLDHIDVIRGLVTGYKAPGAADYSGEWPRNTAWLSTAGVTAGLAAVPAAAKNTSATRIKTFNTTTWVDAGGDFRKMSFRIPAVNASQYLRLRGTNLPAALPSETDADGNPLADLFTNANDLTKLSIPCTPVHSAASQFDGCPDHLAVAAAPSPIAGQKAVSFDVAAWADLWFYSNPIYIQVTGSNIVAGVR
jgi:hypothetical protein